MPEHRNWDTYWDAFWLHTLRKCGDPWWDIFMLLSFSSDQVLYINGLLEADNDNVSR